MCAMFISRVEKDVRDINRLRQIMEILLKHEFGFFVEKVHLKHLLPMHKRLQKDMFVERKTQPVHVREMIEELGGAFPKLGQLLSLRPDLIPPDFCDELRKLQDQIKPFPFDKVKEVLEQEYQKPLEKVFRRIDPEPVASASIAQVHKAVLKDGTLVAVKVQRPKIQKQMVIDIEILEILATQIKKHLNQEFVDPQAIVEEFRRYTRNELDFIKEAKNIDIFYGNFKADPEVVIPKVFWPHTTEKVLVMEYVKGHKLSSWPKFSEKTRTQLANRYIKAILSQVFEHGFFHGDPHPGNLIITPKNEIAFLDFGIVGFFDGQSKEELLSLFISMMTGDISQMVNSLIDLDIVDVQVNEQKLKDDLFMTLSKYYDTSLDRLNISTITVEMLELARADHIKVPANFVLLMKAVMTAESVAQQLDPKFNIMDVGKPFLLELARKERSPVKVAKRLTRSFVQVKDFIQKMPRQTQEVIRSLKKGDELVQNIDTDIKMLTTVMDRSSNRISLGLLILALFLSSAFLMNLPQPAMFGYPIISLTGFGIGIFLVILLIISITRQKNG